MLDTRLQKDISELATQGEITNALALNGLIAAMNGQTSFATRALPGYYVGRRDSSTVMVMLNHGINVAVANGNLQRDITFRRMNGINDIVNYHKSSENFGTLDKRRMDPFDIKTAFFIKKWANNGINLPLNLSPTSCKQTKLNAKEAVLNEKLQLELIPYASSTFKEFNAQDISKLFPYVETLFDEIFSKERKYVIFCSRIFEQVFEAYERQHPGHIKFRDEQKYEIPDLKFKCSCRVIEITYKGVTKKAIIANTFPHQALTNAYQQMEAYGDFCYQEYIK